MSDQQVALDKKYEELEEHKKELAKREQDIVNKEKSLWKRRRIQNINANIGEQDEPKTGEETKNDQKSNHAVEVDAEESDEKDP